MDTPSSEKESNFYTLKKFRRPLRSPFYNFQKIFNPEWFQGNNKTEKYFEGWYFKSVSADENNIWSFIPGISLVNGDNHAFVQAINGQSGQTFYFRFAIEAFSFSSQKFEISIANNRFGKDQMTLDLNDGTHQFKGHLRFSEISSYDTRVRRPGIMGWYRYVPFMECYHGLVNLDHKIMGHLEYNGNPLNFDFGRGYIEKDWGSSMPKAWIWMQTNHFDHAGTSFMLSVARIPWIGKTFTGFLGYFFYNGMTFTFATYTGAKIKDLQFLDRGLQLTIVAKRFIIELLVTKGERTQNPGSGGLKAPVLGQMDRVIHESIDSNIRVKFKDRAGRVLFFGEGRNSGFEMVGDMQLLTQK